MRTKLVTGPAVEPVTLADLKQHLRVSISDDDAYIASLAASARRLLEKTLSVSLVHQTWDLILDAWPNAWIPRGGWGREAPYIPASTRQVIRIPNPPLASVTSINYLDPNGTSQLLAADQYRVLDGIPGEIIPAFSRFWPVLRADLETITIRYVSGYSADASLVPETLKHWIKLTVASAYENREQEVETRGLVKLPYAAQLLAAEDPGIYA